jgi:hypothetical protein
MENYFNINKKCDNCEKIRCQLNFCINCKNIKNIENIKEYLEKYENKKNKIIEDILLQKKLLNEKIKIYCKKYDKNYFLEALNQNTNPTSEMKNILSVMSNKRHDNKEKADEYIKMKYENIFSAENKEFSTSEIQLPTKPEMRDYIENIIKLHNCNYILEIVTCSCIRRSSVHEISLMYDILYDTKILKSLKFFIHEHNIIFVKRSKHMKIDFMTILEINDKDHLVFIEIDDYNNYEKLTGGHSYSGRKYVDILKDVYCWCFGASMIRMTCNKNPLNILRTLFQTKSFPTYIFYQNYFNNKRQSSLTVDLTEKIDGYAISVPQCEESPNKTKQTSSTETSELEQKKRLDEILSKCNNTIRK